MNGFQRDERKSIRAGRMLVRAERITANMDRDCSWDRRKIKRRERLEEQAFRIMARRTSAFNALRAQGKWPRP